MTFSVPGYRIDRLLGYGSHTEVWAAQAGSSGERVALKRIVVSFAAGAGQAAARLAVLDHPNLIRFREFLMLDSAMVLVLELAEAGSLADLLRRRGTLSPAEVVATVGPVAAALAHAHERGVLHGSISPANILFTAAGHPKLADLGIAGLVASTDASSGVPVYLDPSVAVGGTSGAASDLFALGAIALQALTGAGPWSCSGAAEPTAEQVLALASTGRIAEWNGRLVGFEPKLAAVVRRVLDPESHRRGTAAEFAQELGAAMLPVPVVLAGGRILPEVGRHSVERAAARNAAAGNSAPRVSTAPRVSSASQVSTATRASSATGRPEFRLVAAEVAGDLTPVDQGPRARLRVRAAIAELAATESDVWSSPRWTKHLLDRKLALVGAAVLLLLTLWLLGGVPGWLGHRAASAVAPIASPPPSSASQLSAGQSSSSQLSSGPSSVGPWIKGPSSARPSRSAGATPRTRSAMQPAGIDAVPALAALDRLRAQAYAERRPELLARVYDSGALLAQDTEQLSRTVPAGCVLSGLRTSYHDLRPAAVATGRVQLWVSASLSAATLSCAGTARGSTSATGPIRLKVTLTSTAGLVRISGEQLAGS